MIHYSDINPITDRLALRRVCKSTDPTPRRCRSYYPHGGVVALWYGGNGLEGQIKWSSETKSMSNKVKRNMSCAQPWNLVSIPTPKNSGAMKMAAVGPMQGTSIGSMAPLNTSSSVTGATTWFLSHTASPAHNIHDWTSRKIKLRLTDRKHAGTRVKLP